MSRLFSRSSASFQFDILVHQIDCLISPGYISQLVHENRVCLRHLSKPSDHPLDEGKSVDGVCQEGSCPSKKLSQDNDAASVSSLLDSLYFCTVERHKKKFRTDLAPLFPIPSYVPPLNALNNSLHDGMDANQQRTPALLGTSVPPPPPAPPSGLLPKSWVPNVRDAPNISPPSFATTPPVAPPAISVGASDDSVAVLRTSLTNLDFGQQQTSNGEGLSPGPHTHAHTTVVGRSPNTSAVTSSSSLNPSAAPGSPGGSLTVPVTSPSNGPASPAGLRRAGSSPSNSSGAPAASAIVSTAYTPNSHTSVRMAGGEPATVAYTGQRNGSAAVLPVPRSSGPKWFQRMTFNGTLYEQRRLFGGKKSRRRETLGGDSRPSAEGPCEVEYAPKRYTIQLCSKRWPGYLSHVRDRLYEHYIHQRPYYAQASPAPSNAQRSSVLRASSNTRHNLSNKPATVESTPKTNAGVVSPVRPYAVRMDGRTDLRSVRTRPVLRVHRKITYARANPPGVGKREPNEQDVEGRSPPPPPPPPPPSLLGARLSAPSSPRSSYLFEPSLMHSLYRNAFPYEYVPQPGGVNDVNLPFAGPPPYLLLPVNRILRYLEAGKLRVSLNLAALVNQSGKDHSVTLPLIEVTQKRKQKWAQELRPVYQQALLVYRERVRLYEMALGAYKANLLRQETEGLSTPLMPPPPPPPIPPEPTENSSFMVPHITLTIRCRWLNSSNDKDGFTPCERIVGEFFTLQNGMTVPRPLSEHTAVHAPAVAPHPHRYNIPDHYASFPDIQRTTLVQDYRHRHDHKRAYNGDTAQSSAPVPARATMAVTAVASGRSAGSPEHSVSVSGGSPRVRPWNLDGPQGPQATTRGHDGLPRQREAHCEKRRSFSDVMTRLSHNHRRSFGAQLAARVVVDAPEQSGNGGVGGDSGVGGGDSGGGGGEDTEVRGSDEMSSPAMRRTPSPERSSPRKHALEIPVGALSEDSSREDSFRNPRVSPVRRADSTSSPARVRFQPSLSDAGSVLGSDPQLSSSDSGRGRFVGEGLLPYDAYSMPLIASGMVGPGGVRRDARPSKGAPEAAGMMEGGYDLPYGPDAYVHYYNSLMYRAQLPEEPVGPVGQRQFEPYFAPASALVNPELRYPHSGRAASAGAPSSSAQPHTGTSVAHDVRQKPSLRPPGASDVGTAVINSAVSKERQPPLKGPSDFSSKAAFMQYMEECWKSKAEDDGTTTSQTSPSKPSDAEQKEPSSHVQEGDVTSGRGNVLPPPSAAQSEIATVSEQPGSAQQQPSPAGTHGTSPEPASSSGGGDGEVATNPGGVADRIASSPADAGPPASSMGGQDSPHAAAAAAVTVDSSAAKEQSEPSGNAAGNSPAAQVPQVGRHQPQAPHALLLPLLQSNSLSAEQKAAVEALLATPAPPPALPQWGAMQPAAAHAHPYNTMMMADVGAGMWSGLHVPAHSRALVMPRWGGTPGAAPFYRGYTHIPYNGFAPARYRRPSRRGRRQLYPSPGFDIPTVPPPGYMAMRGAAVSSSPRGDDTVLRAAGTAGRGAAVSSHAVMDDADESAGVPSRASRRMLEPSAVRKRTSAQRETPLPNVPLRRAKESNVSLTHTVVHPAVAADSESSPDDSDSSSSVMSEQLPLRNQTTFVVPVNSLHDFTDDGTRTEYERVSPAHLRSSKLHQ